MAKTYIDVSKWQGVIDWETVKNQVDGVIIRAGYGKNNIDDKFVRNITECNRLGIPCGVYWFSYAYTVEMAKAEAKYCLEAIKPYRVELPVCFDFEYDSVEFAKKNGVTITKRDASDFVLAFCGTIENAGYYAMNYTNPAYLGEFFDESTLRFDLWLAQWPNNPNPEKPPRKCGIWQYTSKGRYEGIDGNVDTNAAYYDYPNIIRNAGLNKLAATEEPTKEPTNNTTDEKTAARNWAVNKGISDGKRPNEPATRSEIWSMLYRLIGGK